MTRESESSGIRALALAAKEASRAVASSSVEVRDRALRLMAGCLRAHKDGICAQNARDVEAGRAAGMAPSLIDRLLLTPERVESMACALEDLVALPDPIGRILEERTIDEGLRLAKVSVPLGLVAVIYEARPNVTADAAGICLKAGNACVLRGGSQARLSNVAIADALREGVVSAGLPADAVSLVADAGHASADELMGLRGTVDVLIPRGSAALIGHCVEHAKVPVIETGVGNCHVYVHGSADPSMARDILVNAKTQRIGVCNACESLLYDASLADAPGALLAVILRALTDAGVTLHADDRTAALLDKEGIPFRAAEQSDWGREYLSLDISVKSVRDVREAIAHVNRYGTGHSECIVADEDDPRGHDAVQAFLRDVDAAVVYANASTRFSDGGCFGLGAEIGISTQKLHVRGPFATDALTSTKYIVHGSGQVRK